MRRLAPLLPLLGASSWALAAVVTRKMSGQDPAATTLVYSAIVGIVLMSLLQPFVWVTPGLPEIGLGLAMGVLSTLGHWLVILAYRHADASISGSKCANVPTAPEVFPTAIVSIARNIRSRSRPNSAQNTASFNPNVVGSACTPWVRPIIVVCLCSRARAAR